MNVSLKRWKWCLRLAVAGTFIAFLYLWMTLRPPLWYYQQSGRPQELPRRLIRPAFRKIAGWDLPAKSEELRAQFHGGRDPAIFVRFQTDSEGISRIGEHVAPFRAEFEPFSGTPGFYIVSQWEEESGVRILDQRVIESGLRLKYYEPGALSFEIVVDTQRNTVQIWAAQK